MQRLQELAILLFLVLSCGRPVVCRDYVTERASVSVPQNAGGATTSPFEPPEEDDRRFVINGGPMLDTDCLYNDQGPIVMQIEVTRYVGELNSDGTLQNPGALIAGGHLSPTATLTLPVWDVDSDANPERNLPEFDEVYFNDNFIGLLTGSNEIWNKNALEIPVELVRFAEKGVGGSEPTPGVNEIRIEIDTGHTQKIWCTAVDWVALDFRTVSPIVLIHGNGSDSGFFDRQGFSEKLRQDHLPVEGCGACGTPVDLPAAPIQLNGLFLKEQVSSLARSLGVDSVHMVAHSKGGLDVREYLGKHYGEVEGEFNILSLTTLSTPHDGSLGADVLVLREDFGKVAGNIFWENFPLLTDILAGILGSNGGTSNLTTWFVAAFNQYNLGLLPTQVSFHTIGADADRNDSGKIDLWEEYSSMALEEQMLSTLPTFLGARLVDQAYQVLRRIDRIEYEYSCREIRNPPEFRRKRECTARLIGVPYPGPRGNDIMVTVESALGAGGFGSLASRTAALGQMSARNHASVADAGVAETVKSWILSVERERGDLKP